MSSRAGSNTGDVSAPPPSLEPGARLGPYTVVSLLGAGSMAEVYRAEGPGGDVALKVPRRPAFLRHLRREGLLLAEVDHPNVARFLGADLEADVPYLAMQLVAGQPLRALCRGTIAAQQATLLSDQVLAGLAAIHRAGVLHLDLKPENVLVRPDGSAVVVDLGLGRAASALMAEVYLSASLASRDLPFAGTLAYMAPEQRKGRPCDGRADLFAFGVLLHELLSGRLPDPTTRLTDLRADLAPRWDVTVARLTHPDPDRRPADADEARRLVAFTLGEKLTIPVVRGGVEPRRIAAYDEDALAQASPYVAGMVIGDYELVAPLGRGGYGEVWEARRGEQVAALKLPSRDEARAGLAVEAAAARRIEHRGVPRILHDGTTEEPPYVVLERVEGTSLRLRLNEDGQLPLRAALETFLGMVDVVAACHAAGVVHRDLKPEHFLVLDAPRGGEVKVSLIDFGLAAFVGAQPPPLEASLASRADARGTFDYMAPEQREAVARSGPPTDVYALGVCLYEMLTDDLPRGPQRPRALRSEVPDAVDRLCVDMLDRAPSARPSLAHVREVVADALRAAPRSRGRAAAEGSGLMARVLYSVRAAGAALGPRGILALLATVAVLVAWTLHANAPGLAVPRCVYCGASAYGRPCQESDAGAHYRPAWGWCAWCGAPPSDSQPCPFGPRGRHDW